METIELPHIKAISKKYSTGLRWSFFGSLFFETMQLLNNSMLFYFMGSHSYGQVGALFSVIYVMVYALDMGFEASLAAFLPMATESKKNFKYVFLWYTLPQLLIVCVGSFLSFFIFKSILFYDNQNIPFIFFPILIVSESFRIFFRRFLHNVFYNRPVVIVEQTFAIAYYGSIWISYLIFGHRLTSVLILSPFLFNSLFSVIFFLLLTRDFYNTLPNGEATIPDKLLVPVLRTRYYNFLLGLENLLISGDALVTIFAGTFGYAEAGILKIASMVTRSIKSLSKSIIQHAGVGLLISIKKESVSIKKKAFAALSGYQNRVIVFIGIILITQYHSHVFLFPPASTQHTIWTYAILLTGVALIHQLFMSYEQFYLVEGASSKLVLVKAIEFPLFYFLIFSNPNTTPQLTLGYMVLIEIFSFSLLATHAYVRWKILPYLKLTRNFFLVAISSALVIQGVLRLIAILGY